jgi:hypothetical protein
VTEMVERRRVRHRDYTEAMRRAHVISRYGSGANEKLPPRIRPTNQQVGIWLGGAGALLFGWWVLRSVLDRLLPGQVWIIAAVALPFVVAAVWHRKPIDERILARSVRSSLGHRVASRGRITGVTTVHGRTHKNARRRAKTRKGVLVPAREVN